jgi:tetratricopeptide (TPR) repeat protein
MKQFILLGLIALASSGSQDAIVYYGSGLAKSTKGDLDGAIADFSKAIELNPKLAEAYLNRGLAKSTKGDQDGAIANESQAIELNPNLPKPTSTVEVPSKPREIWREPSPMKIRRSSSIQNLLRPTSTAD